MKILVTGHKGFIGSHLMKKLQSLDYDPLGLEIYDDPYSEFFTQHHYDVIYHLGAVARTNECTEAPFDQAHISNIELTKVLLSKYNFDTIVYASSCAIYGSHKSFINEQSAINAPSIYAVQKYLSERYIHYDCQHRGKNSVCLRLFNTYGPGQSQLGKYPNVIASLIKSYHKNNFVEITGNGNQTRDFVYIDDVVDAFVKSKNIKGNYIINISTGVETSINDLVKSFGWTPNVEYLHHRPFDILRQVANNDFALKVLNWSPKVSIFEGIKKTLNYESIL